MCKEGCLNYGIIIGIRQGHFADSFQFHYSISLVDLFALELVQTKHLLGYLTNAPASLTAVSLS
jgi:hypothetical protein